MAVNINCQISLTPDLFSDPVLLKIILLSNSNCIYVWEFSIG